MYIYIYIYIIHFKYNALNITSKVYMPPSILLTVSLSLTIMFICIFLFVFCKAAKCL